MFEKFFVINQIDDVFSEMDYENSVSVDFHGTPMHGLPFPNTLTKFTFCLSPGNNYTLHAVDAAGDGWWGGARYSVIVGGATVIDEEMAASIRQSTAFTVSRSGALKTSFSANRASQGGGGAIFWEDVPPGDTENYRNSSKPNTALYGDYAATPARELVATPTDYTYHAGMPLGDIAAELKDW